MPGEALAARHLRKNFAGRRAVDDVSFRIEQGECVGLLGPNGAGKSTTLKMCLGACVPTGGDIRLLGYPLPQQALAARQFVGVVPQQDNLDPDFSCRENLQIYGRYFGLEPDRETLDNLLTFAGLLNRADDKIAALSGGMQRRLTLARALVNQPDFIFLDEPTTGLDPQARHMIWERLHSLHAQGKALLLTTHFMEEAERLCSRIYIMDEGRLIAEGAPAALVAETVEKEVVEVYGDAGKQFLSAHPGLYQRRESFGELTYCYTARAEPLCAALGAESLRYTHRPANLEDVFLALTGRDLRE